MAHNPEEQVKRGVDELTREWAIGSRGWKQALARGYGLRALALDLPRNETFALKVQRWITMLETELRSRGKDPAAAAQDPTSIGERWKLLPSCARSAGLPIAGSLNLSPWVLRLPCA